MSPTTRLHYDDSLLFRFDAHVAAHAELAGKPSVVLDRTAFYPEAGGQMGDTGTISGIRVIDVQVDDAGVVHHIVAAPVEQAAIGSSVVGEIDGKRRRLHMALHTGQHMLSRALADVAHAETVSSRLGETVCTIDLDRDQIDERLIAQAEDLVNAVVDDDIAIRAYFPDESELSGLPLRRAPKVTSNVRIIAIGDFDVSPCGGTHCTRSAQVGLVRVTGVERYKGKMRVLFAAGPRARRELAMHDDALRALARQLTCAPTDVGLSFDKVRRELEGVREMLGSTRAQLAESMARSLLQAAEQTGGRQVVAVFEEGGVEMLRAVAARLIAHPEVVALLAARTDDGLLMLVDRAKGSTFDCGALVKRIAAIAGGRGGGRPDHAEGRLPKECDWPALVAASR